MFNYKNLSKNYKVRRLEKEDINKIFELTLTNPLYYRHCPPNPSPQSIKDDMVALPPNKSLEDKFYIGFFKDNNIIAVMDLIVGYPNDKTIFWGFFMVDASVSGMGIGSEIVEECSNSIKKQGYQSILLAFMKTNPQSKVFWEKCGFSPTGVETDNGQGILVVMSKNLN